jgi:mRNA interferase HicA
MPGFAPNIQSGLHAGRGAASIERCVSDISVRVWGAMNGREFVARVRRLGRRRGVAVVFDPQQGKGSHGMLRYGARSTTVPDLRRDLKPGLLHAMCRQIGIEPDELRKM